MPMEERRGAEWDGNVMGGKGGTKPGGGRENATSKTGQGIPGLWGNTRFIWFWGGSRIERGDSNLTTLMTL